MSSAYLSQPYLTVKEIVVQMSDSHKLKRQGQKEKSNPGIEPRSAALQADSLPAEPQGKPVSKESEVKSLSRVCLFATLWTVAHQAPPSMGFSRQEYRSGLPFTSPGDLPDPRIEPGSPALRFTL